MAIPFFFRNMPDEAAAKANLDIIGIGLLTISIVMFAVYISLYHVFYLLAGIFCLIGAAVHTRHAEHPFIDRSLIKNRRYIGSFWQDVLYWEALRESSLSFLI
ncbi:MAG: hypothetical protein ACOX5H_16700 [Bacillus licheniformis]